MGALRKNKTKRDVVTEFRHGEILEAAQRVFARRGFTEASVEAIAQEAGLAKGTVYLYYPSKRALYWAALRHGLLGLGEELARRVAAAESLREKIRAFVDTKVSYFEEHRDFVQIYYAEFTNVVAHPCAPLRDFQEFYLQQVGILKAEIHEAVRKRAIARVPEDTAAFAIFDLTKGMIMRRMLGWSKSRTKEDIDFVVDLAWRGLAPR
jgi:AcrR family transcriptional regulator